MLMSSNFDHDAVLSKGEGTSHVDDQAGRTFKLLIEQSNDLHFTFAAADNRFLYINPVVKEMLGFTMDEAMGLTPQAMMTAASMGELCNTLHRTVAEHSSGQEVIIVKPQHLQLLAKDRRRIHVEIRLFISMKSDHTIDTISGSVRSDLMWLKNRREAHEDSEQKYHALLEGVKDAVVRIRSTGEVLDCKPDTKNALLPSGFSAGNTIYTLCSDEADRESLRKHFLLTFETGTLQQVETVLVKEDRQIRAEVRIVPESDSTALVIMRDCSYQTRAEDESTKSTPPQSRQGRILVMDDEEILLDLAKQMCQRVGLEADTVQNHNDAVEQYRIAFKRGHPYAAVLLDMTIAGGIGGIETAAALRKIDPRVKVIVMSGYSDHEVMAEPEKYGFSGVMTKPFRLNEFQKVFGEILPLDEFRSGGSGTNPG